MARKPGAGGIIVVALILGVVTVVLAYRWLNEQSKRSEANWKPVVVAVKNIEPRKKITLEMIDLARFPEAHIAEDALTDLKEVEGKIAVARIRSKEQIRKSDLALEGRGSSLAYQIPDGKRAIAIEAGEVMAVGTTIKPGDHVDIIATYVDPVAKYETTQMILQNVVVLAVNKGQTDPSGDEGANSSMTLAVTPDEAHLVTAASRAGALRVALRPVGDEQIVTSPGVTVYDFGGNRIIEKTDTGSTQTPIIISPPPARKRRLITIIRETQEQEVSYRGGQR